MPLYDYRCEQCGDFTELRKMSEAGDMCGMWRDGGADHYRTVSCPDGP